jgi:hypothetical protein
MAKRLITVRTLFLLALLSVVAAHSQAEKYFGLSSGIQDKKTLAVQRKAEALFDKASFERAFLIYHRELAPLGDKYAQYMVGFMYETGLGIEKDKLVASAWYRLAAARGTPEFLSVVDKSMRYFTADDIRQSDVIFSRLRLDYSDMAVMIESIGNDVHELKVRTGSRLRGETSPVAVISARSGNVRSGADYYGSIERRLAERLQRLSKIEGFEDINTDPKTVNVRVLKRRVVDYIENQAF